MQPCIPGKAKNGTPTLTALSRQLFPAKQGHFFPTKEVPVTSQSEETQWEGDRGWQPLVPGRDQLELPSPSSSTPFGAHTSVWKAESFLRESWISLSCTCGHPTCTLHPQECRAGVPSWEPPGTCPNCHFSVSGSAHISKPGEHGAAAGDHGWNCHLQGASGVRKGDLAAKLGQNRGKLGAARTASPDPFPTEGLSS